ncbi:hypothetical protein HanXRQr2_Chr01g0020521 [Helianthus annuus]|uniref:Uncharacterized protein n=1 Tax=Helianthus annuus TaxID=4232 RepID=A0A9K3JUX4_HELAN|nr:hypothetical protein HanXRQr2_Chr01g0020521 [Helianthus annuus]
MILQTYEPFTKPLTVKISSNNLKASSLFPFSHSPMIKYVTISSTRTNPFFL